MYDTNDDSTRTGFDKFFNNGAVIYPTVSLPTTFFGMPGHQSLWGVYSIGRYAIVTPQSLTLLPQVLQGRLAPTALGTLRPRFLVDHLLVRSGALGRSHGQNSKLGRVRQFRDQRWKAKPDQMVRHFWHRREQPDSRPQTGYLRRRILLPRIQRRLQEHRSSSRARTRRARPGTILQCRRNGRGVISRLTCK